jgi:hypothetical protein
VFVVIFVVFEVVDVERKDYLAFGLPVLQDPVLVLVKMKYGKN